MSLQTRLGDLITAIGTDYKNIMATLGGLANLTTTDKSSYTAAINEVKASATGAPPSATETQAGVAEVATQTETNTGTADNVMVTPLKFHTRLLAYAQPLSTNLTNLAGQASTSFGRGLLNLTDHAALRAGFPATTDTVASIQRNATQAEVNAGTNDATQVTPLKLQTRLAAYAMPLSYLDTDVALTANSDVKVPSQKAVKAYADGLLDANNAFKYKGVIDASANPNYPAGNAGDVYKISVAGRIGGAGGAVVEAGDSVTLLVDGSAAGTHATVGANWLITQTNIDGAVVGPASSTAGALATFSGTTGKVVADSGVSIDNDGALAANSATRIPTQAAIRTFLAANFYTKTEIGNPETDLAAAYATAKA